MPKPSSKKRPVSRIAKPKARRNVSIGEAALQLVFPGFTFGVDDPADAELLTELGVGGFCLYGGKVEEIAALTRRLQAKAKVPLLFCADYEDGTGIHVSGGTVFPSNMGIGASGREELARRKAQITAVEAFALGVRWVLAPVLDLATLPSNPIVNVRSFGSDPKLVARMGRAYMRGLKEGGVLSCAKHFPGHGETEKDSHLELPVLRRTRRQLLERELVPFAQTRTLADSVMMAHLRIPALKDAPELPSSLSKKAVDGLLRRTVRFTRLAVTDALSMHAVSDHYSDDEAAVLALSSGVDVLLVPANPKRLAYALPGILESKKSLHARVRAAHRRLMKAKEACGLFKDHGLAPEEDLKKVGCELHREEAERMTAACLTWIRKEEIHLSAGRGVHYLEPDADGPEEWQGRAFVHELKSLGIDVRPYENAGQADSVIVGSFFRPRAYSGRIEFSDEEKRRAESALASSPNSFLAAFGSPFVFDQLHGWRTGLCAFGAGETAQKLAAWALVGRLKVPGKAPVPLENCSYKEPPSWASGYRRHVQQSKTYAKEPKKRMVLPSLWGKVVDRSPHPNPLPQGERD